MAAAAILDFHDTRLALELFRTTTVIACYLCAQWVDNARVEEDHQRQRQKISNEQQEKCYHLLLSNTAVDAPRYTDSINDIRAETRHQYLESWDENPDRAYDGNIYHALFGVLLQTEQF